MNRSIVNWQCLDNPALILESGDIVNYAELKIKVDDFAKRLKPQELIFLFGSNDLSTLVCYLACLQAKAVPLLLSKDASKISIDSFFERYRPRYFFTPLSQDITAVNFKERWRNDDGYILQENVFQLPANLNSDLALLMPTSGTTGSPKLVKLSTGNILANARSIIEYLGISVVDRAITSLPFNYSYGLSIIHSHLMAGASLVITNSSIMEAAFWKCIDAFSVTSIAGVPYSYDMLLKLRFERRNLATIKTMTQAGGRLAPQKMKQVFDICSSKGINFFTMYGQTEATARISYLSPENLDAKLGSIGKAIPGGRLWIEDVKGEKIHQPGMVGELIYEGPNVFMGYAECESDLKVGDTQGGILRTGDLARLDEDGYFFIEGRKNRFLKIFGVRISLDDVEWMLINQGHTVAAHGNDDQLIISIEQDENYSNFDKLRNSLGVTLGIHHSAILMRSMKILPRLDSGKVDYQCLNQMI